MNLKERTCKFEKCYDLIVSVDVVTRTQSHFKRTIRAISFIIIALNAITKILVIYKKVISKDRDFLFKSDCL